MRYGRGLPRHARVPAHAPSSMPKTFGAKAKPRLHRRQATGDAAAASLAPVIADLGGVAIEALGEVVQVSRRVRGEREALAAAEAGAVRGGEGHAPDAPDAQWRAADPDAVAARADALGPLLADANARVASVAEAAGEAKRAFAALDLPGGDAAGAAGDAEQARAEMAAQAEAYLLKRAQALTLRWAIERYRQERQDPLLVRARALFRRLTLGRFGELRIDYDAATPRLLGVRDDGRQAIDVEAMSDGTADQLFLALRLAAAKQSVAAGVRLPFLVDDLFINFDDVVHGPDLRRSRSWPRQPKSCSSRIMPTWLTLRTMSRVPTSTRSAD